MNRPASNLTVARSWRDIPQEVAPRSMSREGRKRLVMGFVKVGLGLLLTLTLVWAAWELLQTWQNNPTRLAAPVKSAPVRVVKLTTNGVLDEAWVLHRLALPRGVSLMELDLQVLQDALLADHQIRTAVLTRKFPDTLVVTLQERTPVGRIRVQERSGGARDLLVARDGVVFVGINFEPTLVSGLPWLDGITLTPARGGGFNPVLGMETLADLFETAQVNVPLLYRTWRVASLERFSTYGEIVIRTDSIPEITFGLRDNFYTQIALLDAVLAETQSKPVQSINLSFGKKQVPVVFAPLPGVALPPASTVTPGIHDARRAAPDRPLTRPTRPFFTFQPSQPRETSRDL
ncbi:MAG: FtsQ-type POTRA domain-containing protein [Opitutaceae bacterium]